MPIAADSSPLALPALPALPPSPLARGDELPVGQAQAAIAAACTAWLEAPEQRRLAEPDNPGLAELAGRVLTADVVSPIDVPAHDNSAMDGFAFNGAALAADAVADRAAAAALVLAVQTTLHAGDAALPPIAPGHCARIMTGAVMPPGTDTVVPFELCRVEGEQLHIAPGVVKAGENRRARGEDLARGSVALPAGRRLRDADVGLIASLGLATAPVRPRLRVALFSTGNELREPGQALDSGCIYDSNRASLRAALQATGAQVIDLGLVRDDPAALAATLACAVADADAIVTSGGVSMGDADHTRDVLAAHGDVAFWKVAIRPGRPFAFGPVRGEGGRSALLFALPGNPVAALVAFHVFVRDALRQLAGASARPAPLLRARAAASIRKRPGRSEYQRGVLNLAADGRWEVRLTGAQGAGVLSSMSRADGLIVLGPEQGSVAAGDEVEVMLLGESAG